MKGIVLKSTGSWYDILGEDGETYAARTRGKLRLKGIKTTNPIAVGDQVQMVPESGNQMLIEDILPRENYIIRQSVHKRGHAHILAANIDQVVLIVTLSQPRTSLGFIDRFLVSAESFRIPQVLIFNKQDLLDPDDQNEIDRLIPMYEEIGVTCLQTSATTGHGLDAMRALLDHKTSLLAGHSGVGKSTLLNYLSPEIGQKTAEISTYVDKGVHTTTFAEMFPLSEATYIIDTPGIKELGLMDIPASELGDYFPEIRERREDCKFYNCLHDREPKCAIKAAVEDGEIAASRYKNYLGMLHSED